MSLVVDDHRDALISPASWTFPQTALRADPHGP
jgi:hypothetical protein